jgi:hypothetical protein
MIWNAEDGTRTRTGLSPQKISVAPQRLLHPFLCPSPMSKRFAQRLCAGNGGGELETCARPA